MRNECAVLIVSTIADVATDEVAAKLSDRGVSFLRINTENYPLSGTLSTTLTPAPEHSVVSEFDQRQFSSPVSVWYRRMRTPSRPDDMDSGVYEFCLQENRAALLGSILSASARWMSHPQAVWLAENKPYQLSLASSLGLRIPRTLISNDPVTIQETFSRFSQMIVKPVRSGHFVRDGKEYSVFTSRVLSSHLENIESARLAPSIYQELIPKKFDIRVTIVGRRLFAVAIDSQSDPDAMVDWRKTTNAKLPHYPLTLPIEIEKHLLNFMQLLGLTFGAIDMIQTPDGEFVFLEVNPSGQWLWIDDILSLGISDAVADWLAGEGHP
jgi:glutathione synthase/RimK-type ligase-like ATP-grasp enzyme